MNFDKKILLNNLPKFAHSSSVAARTLFNRLDPNLNPRIVLVAVPYLDSSDPILICPENCDYLPEWFREIQDIIKELPESYLTDLAFDVQGVVWQEKVNVKISLQKVLDSKCKELGGISFTIFPEFVAGYCVSLILQLSRTALESHYALMKKPNWGYPVTSFVYETIAAFLYSCLTPLEKLARGRTSFALSDRGDEVLRKAGLHLLQIPERLTKNWEARSLFRAFNVISSMSYEHNESKGRIIISRKGHPNVGIALTLSKPAELSNYRGVRKLLEVASENLDLLCGASGIYGFGTLNRLPYNQVMEDLFVVEFSGHYSWKLLHAENEMMVVKYGLPNLPKKLISYEDFKTRVNQIFSRIHDEDLANLWALVREAITQKHGTMIVVSNKAAKEAMRLKNQSTMIRPIALRPELMLPVSSIDGAILVAPNAICHAIGVILDGIASDKGNSARGARYNSAIRYLDYAREQKHSCLIMVVSEDGTVDLL